MSDSRIEKALEYAFKYGGIDGGHHKMWVIDQMVRALTGCPDIEQEAAWGYYSVQGESEEYEEWVRRHCDGEDGPDTYEWDEGIPP